MNLNKLCQPSKIRMWYAQRYLNLLKSPWPWKKGLCKGDNTYSKLRIRKYDDN